MLMIPCCGGTFGESRVPFGEDRCCAVHGGPADAGFAPEIVLGQSAVGARRVSGQEPVHRLSQGLFGA